MPGPAQPESDAPYPGTDSSAISPHFPSCVSPMKQDSIYVATLVFKQGQMTLRRKLCGTAPQHFCVSNLPYTVWTGQFVCSHAPRGCTSCDSWCLLRTAEICKQSQTVAEPSSILITLHMPRSQSALPDPAFATHWVALHCMWKY